MIDERHVVLVRKVWSLDSEQFSQDTDGPASDSHSQPNATISQVVAEQDACGVK